MTHLDAMLQQVIIYFDGRSASAPVVDECVGCGDEEIGAYYQSIGLWGSIHPLNFLVSHVLHSI
jgi:hypothetical protein